MNRQNSRARVIAAAALAGLSLPAAQCAAATAHWLAPVSGSWFDGSKWSTAPDYPRALDVALDAPGPSYTVTAATTATSGMELRNLTITPNAMLDVRTRFYIGASDGSPMTIGGGGTIRFSNSAGLITNNADLTIAADISIFGSSGGIQPSWNLTNFGTITADGGTFLVGTSPSYPWKNQGTLSAINGGILKITGVIAPGGLGAIDSTGGTIILNYQVDNTGNDLVLDGQKNSVVLGGVLDGGSVTTRNGATLSVNSGQQFLPYVSNVRLDTDATVLTSGTLYIGPNVTATSGHKIRMSNLSTINVRPDFSGEIVFQSGTARKSDYIGDQEYGAGMIMRTAGGNGHIGGDGPTYTITNHALISAETNNEIAIFGKGLTMNSDGVLQASAGTMSVSMALSNSGLIDVSGGIFQMTGKNGLNVTTGGLLKLRGGTLDANSVRLTGGISLFDWTAGTLRISSTGSNFGGTLSVPNGGTLKGNGTITDPVNILPGGTISPGDSPGILSTGSVAFTAGSTLLAELNGTTPGISGHDQLNVSGSVDLGNAMLQLLLGYAPQVNDSFTIILNDGADAVAGTFAGFPQGGILHAVDTLGGDRAFRVSYVGGDGNDVVLTTLVPEPSAISFVGLGLPWVIGRRFRYGRR